MIYKITKCENHTRSYKKYWFNFVNLQTKSNIWWDCTFNITLDQVKDITQEAYAEVVERLQWYFCLVRRPLLEEFYQGPLSTFPQPLDAIGSYNNQTSLQYSSLLCGLCENIVLLQCCRLHSVAQSSFFLSLGLGQDKLMFIISLLAD